MSFSPTRYRTRVRGIQLEIWLGQNGEWSYNVVSDSLRTTGTVKRSDASPTMETAKEYVFSIAKENIPALDDSGLNLSNLEWYEFSVVKPRLDDGKLVKKSSGKRSR